MILSGALSFSAHSSSPSSWARRLTSVPCHATAIATRQVLARSTSTRSSWCNKVARKSTTPTKLVKWSKKKKSKELVYIFLPQGLSSGATFGVMFVCFFCSILLSQQRSARTSAPCEESVCKYWITSRGCQRRVLCALMLSICSVGGQNLLQSPGLATTHISRDSIWGSRREVPRLWPRLGTDCEAGVGTLQNKSVVLIGPLGTGVQQCCIGARTGILL